MESLRTGFRRHHALRQLVRSRVRVADIHAHRKFHVQQRHGEDLYCRRHRLRDQSGLTGFLHGNRALVSSVERTRPGFFQWDEGVG